MSVHMQWCIFPKLPCVALHMDRASWAAMVLRYWTEEKRRSDSSEVGNKTNPTAAQLTTLRLSRPWVETKGIKRFGTILSNLTWLIYKEYIFLPAMAIYL